MEFDNAKRLETFKSLIQIAVAGLRLLVVLNGGAAIALLAYLGNVAGKRAAVPEVLFAIGCYLAGLFLTGFAFFCSYLTQLALFNESMGNVRPGAHKKWLRGAMVLVVLSLSAFAAGSVSAVRSFQLPIAAGASLPSPAQPDER